MPLIERILGGDQQMTKKTEVAGGLPVAGYVRQSQLVPNVVPFSAATLWRNVKSGRFPAPVKLSQRVTAWRVEDIRAWMQATVGAGENR